MSGVETLTGAEYVYDGDGTLVNSIINGISTYYAGRHYNIIVNGEDTHIQKTYAFGSISGAVRNDGVLTWLLSDHLGSTSITAIEDGNLKSEIRYSAFGEVRYSSGSTPTDYQYTNQLNQPDNGLYYYVARFYDPVIAHFVQADTIVPGAGNPSYLGRFTSRDTWGGDFNRPLSLNAWNYVEGNPIIDTDPSGMCTLSETNCLDIVIRLYHDYGWEVDSRAFSEAELNQILDAAKWIEGLFNRYGGEGQARMRGALSPSFITPPNMIGIILGRHHVEGRTVYIINNYIDTNIMIHEMGHILDNLSGNLTASISGGGPSDDMARSLGVDPSKCYPRFYCRKEYTNLIEKAKAEKPATDYSYNGPSEDFAETFKLLTKFELTKRPQRAEWFEKFIRQKAISRSPYGDIPSKFLWFLRQPIPVSTCSDS